MASYALGQPFSMANVLANVEAIQGARYKNALAKQAMDPNSRQNQLLDYQIEAARLANEKARNPTMLGAFGEVPGLEGYYGQHNPATGGYENLKTTPGDDDGTTAMKNWIASGGDFDTPEGREGFRKYLTESRRNVNVTLPQPPPGFLWNDPMNPAAGVTPIKGSKQEKDLGTYTDAQSKAATFANMMDASTGIMSQLTQAGFDPSQLIEHAADKVAFGNYFKSPLGRRYRNAQEAWVRAKLRKESGAVIGADEMSDEIVTFFPQPGDDAGTIEQKRILRMVAMNSLIDESQGAYKGKKYEIPKFDVKSDYEERLRKHDIIQ